MCRRLAATTLTAKAVQRPILPRSARQAPLVLPSHRSPSSRRAPASPRLRGVAGRYQSRALVLRAGSPCRLRSGAPVSDRPDKQGTGWSRRRAQPA